MQLWWVALAHAFPKYPYRDVRFPSKWLFSFSPDGKTSATPWEMVNVPDAFDVRHVQHPNMPLKSPRCVTARSQAADTITCASPNTTVPANARGVGTYKLTLLSNSVRVILHGCQMRCIVRLNGALLADVVPMLAPVSIRLPAANPNEALQELTIEVDNRFNDVEWPTHNPRFDWYQTGGLVRPVEIHRRVDIINSVRVVFVNFQKIHVKTETTSALVDTLYVSLDGSCSTNIRGIPIAANVSWAVLLNTELAPWSPENPNLYLLSVAAIDAYNKTIDCVIVRFGARTIRTENSLILLNDKPIKLKGVNRHESKSRGSVFSMEDLVVDIRALKALGANFVRGSHYAQDSRFLNLCDENGIMIWEEVLGWQNTLSEIENSVFWQQTMDATQRMVEAHAHHPSIILWGFLNEFIAADDSRSTPYFTEIVDFIRSMDDTRLVSWGSSVTVKDVNLHLVDVIAFHAYTAWYPTRMPLNVDAVANILSVWAFYADWVRDNYGKPFLASEAGAGALYGRHGSSTGAKWSEEVQSVLVQMHVIAAMLQPHMCGIAIWQFADSLVDTAFQDAVTRPRGLNNKGLLSLSREQKISFSAVAKMFHDDNFVLMLPQGEEEKGNLEVWNKAIQR